MRWQDHQRPILYLFAVFLSHCLSVHKDAVVHDSFVFRQPRGIAELNGLLQLGFCLVAMWIAQQTFAFNANKANMLHFGPLELSDKTFVD